MNATTETTPALNWMDFWSLSDADAIAKVTEGDRERVLDTHSRLRGQSLAATVFNLLRNGVVQASA